MDLAKWMEEFRELFNMLESSDKLALSALLISIVVFLWQVISFFINNKNIKKANRNSLAATKESNLTSNKIYDLEKKYDKHNQRKGMYILSFICQRYFSAFYNLLENKIPNRPTIKNNDVTHKQFIQELKFIESDLLDLVDNPTYIKILGRKPHLSQLRQTLSFDIMELDDRKQKNIDFQINYATYFFFQDLFYYLKKEYSDSKLWKSDLFKNIEKDFRLIKVPRPPEINTFL